MENKKLMKLFKLEEIIDILMDFDIKHFDINTQSIFSEYLFGYVDFYEKSIYINSRLDYKSARETIIHEFLHILKNKYNIKDIEENTEKEAKEIYKILYINSNPYNGENNEKEILG